MPALLFEGLTGASVTLASLYAFMAFYTTKQLIWLQKNTPTGLNTRKLFVMTCLLTCVLRVMSFASMAILDFANEDFHINPSDQDDKTDDDSDNPNRDFFNCAFLVLFDFPDFCCISAYMLLIVVWAEAYLKSRRHWLSSFSFRKIWMLIYFVFNTLLYTVQVTLYSILFFPFVNNNIELTLIYLSLACFNIGLPVLWSVAYLYLAIMFSGFPFSSEDAKMRLQTLSRLGLLWTSARLGWGIVALTTVVEGWLNAAQKSTLFYTLVLIAIFLFAEVLPIWVSVRSGVLNHFSERDVGDNPAPTRYQTLPQDPNSIVLASQHNVLLGDTGRRPRDVKSSPNIPISGSYSSNSNDYATQQNTLNNAQLNRADTFSRGSPPPQSNLARMNTFSGGTEGFGDNNNSNNIQNNDDYWEGGVYGRPSQHNTESYNSSYGAHSATGTSYERRNESRTWAEWLGLSPSK